MPSTMLLHERILARSAPPRGTASGDRESTESPVDRLPADAPAATALPATGQDSVGRPAGGTGIRSLGSPAPRPIEPIACHAPPQASPAPADSAPTHAPPRYAQLC